MPTQHRKTADTKRSPKRNPVQARQKSQKSQKSQKNKRLGPRAVVLLGTQRFDTTLGAQVRGLEVKGPIAVITAGWQERESEDEDLRIHLGTKTLNLRLHQRAEEIFAGDAELTNAHRVRQMKLRHKQDFYRIRLEHELEANHVIRQRAAPPDVLEEEEGASLAAIRSLDAYHLTQCKRVHQEFDDAMNTLQRPSIQKHREEIEALLGECGAIAIAGGHVVSLLNRLRLFGIDELIDDHVVFAWSAGAMVVSERIVLFHDNPPQGPGASEVLDQGLGLVPDTVVFPQPETRLRLDEPERISVLARRFAPAQCLAFPKGSHILWRNGAFKRPTLISRLCDDGSTALWNGEVQS